ncbi:MAG TPA: glycosyltransferase family 4 protein, partial [Thermoleophilaceae bacterium]|nr:glycosyltransferase family 4 protein [Thermoleophilaceae bacterium]
GLLRIPERAPRDEARRALGVPEDGFAVALLGRVSDWKGQDVLARALAEPALAEIGAVGVVAGDAIPGGDAGRRLDALARELGVQERLVRLGFREDVDTVLGAADAVAVPSTRPEPLGLVALEAGAAGLPVVASADGGVAEVVRDGVSGLLVAPRDPAALAGALARLAGDPEEAARLGGEGARLVAAEHAPERVTDALQDLYDGLAGPPGAKFGGAL